jgi:membrane protease YdiL (CAAX protease family)
MEIVIQSVFVGMLVVFAATIPRNLLFIANLHHYTALPWSVPLAAALLYVFWRYAQGFWAPVSTAEFRRTSLRAYRLTGHAWCWSLIAGGLGLVALVAALRVVNRMVHLPQQRSQELQGLPTFTVLALLLMSSLFAGVVEEAGFRGYMQGPIEKRWGIVIAILITGTMFAVAHLDFTLILWPYYVAVAAIYGAVAYLTNSILPTIGLHTAGNIYSNMDLWLHGQAEWQASSGSESLIWSAGIDASFLVSIAAFVLTTAAMTWAYFRLAQLCTKTPCE